MHRELTTQVRRVERLVFAQVGDEYLALDAELNECFALNSMALEIWERLSEPVLVETLCAGLVEEFTVSTEQCHAEVGALLTAWHQAGLVEFVEVK